MFRNILSLLFDPHHNLENKQIIALQNLDHAFQTEISNIHIAMSQSHPLDCTQREGLEYHHRELMESYGYMQWLIKSHPEQIRECGTFKTKYYKNNRVVRME